MPEWVDAERRVLCGDEAKMKAYLIYAAIFAAIALITYITFTSQNF